MITTIEYIQHPYKNRKTFALVLKVEKRTVRHFLKAKPTKPFIRQAKKMMRDFISSGLLIHEHKMFKLK